MTQPQTLTVDQQEILARANEVEAPMAQPPTMVPQPPCGLTAVQNAAEQIRLSAENMRDYLDRGGRERQRLATSLRNAAKAYGEVDDEGEAALDHDGDGSVEAQSAGGAGGDSSAGLQDTPNVAAAGEPDFTSLEAAAAKLESGDQGVSMADFADAWTKFNLALQGDIKRFREFKDWDGEAATACAASLDQQRIWILHMAKLSVYMAGQAQFLAQLQVAARRKHPTSQQIAEVKKLSQDPKYQTEAIKQYAEMQQTSEQVLGEYRDKAAEVQWFEIPKPQPAIKIDPPGPPPTPGLIPAQVMQVAAMAGGGSGQGMQAPMMMPPTGAGAGGGMPSGVGAELGAAGRDAAASLSKDPGMKPMSLGGGGAGGGMPSMPLAEAGGAGTGIPGDSVRPAGAGDVGGLGQAGAGRGSSAGGGGMGMPMGAHGQGGGGTKSKGAQQDEEALYTEDREWTEAVIGQRRRQDMKESK